MNKFIKRRFSLIALTFSMTAFHAHAAIEPADRLCDASVLNTPEVYRCEGFTEEVRVKVGTPFAYQNFRALFPQNWRQSQHAQRHNPVFTVPDSAPDFLKNGTHWSAPLTGLDFFDVSRAFPSVGNADSWGSITGQYTGIVIGASVARGIVFVQDGRREIWAVDAATGKALWRREVIAAAGMGQSIVEEVNGTLMVFAPVGDAAFTMQNAIDFAFDRPHYRGGNFSALYAYNGLTGEPIWRFNTRGSARPAPVYHEGKLYLATNGGELIILDAATGTKLGGFINPGNGYNGLDAPNFYKTPDGRLIILYGIIRPALILGVDVTNPAAPTLAWQYAPPGATANAPGDTSVAVDPDTGLLFTRACSQ